jgi:hypothetical protein
MYLHTRAVCYFSLFIYLFMWSEIYFENPYTTFVRGENTYRQCVYMNQYPFITWISCLLPSSIVYEILWKIFFLFFCFSKEAPPVTCQTFKMPRDCCHIFSNQGNLHMDSNPWNLVSMIIMSTGTFTCKLAFRFKSLHLLK